MPVGWDEGDAPAQMLDVLGRALPSTGTEDLGALGERVLRHVASDEARDAGDQHPHGSTVYKRAIGPKTSISRNAALRGGERSRARRAQSRGEKVPFGNADSWAPAIQYRSLMDADRI